jgi:hypothetical protein
VDANEPTLDDLAGAILDGTSVDWATAQSVANDTERPLVEQLQALATLADFHRQQQRAESSIHRTWGHIRVPEPSAPVHSGTSTVRDTRLDREVAPAPACAIRSEDARTSSIIEEGWLFARVRHLNVV